jgi:hypothetical protein
VAAFMTLKIALVAPIPNAQVWGRDGREARVPSERA